MALKIHLEVSLSTTSTHNSGWNRLESKDLSITLAQGFLLYTRSNMEPYDKVDSGKCSSWLLLFKAKENLAGVMMMPNQRGIIQPRPLTQVSQRHRRGRKLESFWKIFADKLNKTNTCSKDSPPLLSTGVFFFFFFSYVTLGTKGFILWSREEPVEMEADTGSEVCPIWISCYVRIYVLI